MKYAICYRGISYLENYMYDNRNGMTPYNIDFDDVILFNKKFILKPLIENGDEVDFFFNTYESIKLEKYISEFNPKDILIKKYNMAINSYNFSHIWQIIIDFLNLIKNYSNKNNLIYDFVILTRFDLLPYTEITKLFFPKNYITTLTEKDDMFIILDFNLIDYFLEICETYKTKYITHEFPNLLKKHNINVHVLFPNIQDHSNYPFFRNIRHIKNKNHILYIHDLEDIYDENSKYYGLNYKCEKF